MVNVALFSSILLCTSEAHDGMYASFEEAVKASYTVVLPEQKKFHMVSNLKSFYKNLKTIYIESSLLC